MSPEMLWVVFTISILALLASIVALATSCLLIIAIFRGSLDSLEGMWTLVQKLRSIISRSSQFDEGDL